MSTESVYGDGMNMGFAPVMEMDVVQVFEEVSGLRGKPGTEIFFNIPGLDKFTGGLLCNIGESPDDTHVVYVKGPSGSGKGFAKKTLIGALESSVALQDCLTYAGYTPWILDMSFANAAGIALQEGALGPNPTWGNFPNTCLQYISGIVRDGIEWVANTKEDGVTPIMVVEINGTTDPEELDLATSVPSYFKDKPGIKQHGVGIVVSKPVLGNAIKYREGLEGGDPNLILDNNNPLLADNKIQLDQPVPLGVLRRTSGSPHSVRGAYAATNNYMVKLARQRGERGVTIARLESDDVFRQGQLRDHMIYLFEEAGIEDYIVEANPLLVNKALTYLVSSDIQYGFPFDKSSRPYPRPYNL